MPLFVYKAVGSDGNVVEGELEAADEQALVRLLQDSGQIPLRTGPARQGRGLRRSLARRNGRIKQTDIASFTAELATLLQAGLPLDRALQILIDLAEREDLQQLMRRIQERVHQGAAFSDALEAQGGTFSPLYVNLVRAGEAGGTLEDALARLAQYLERARSLRESVVSALVYPTILLTVAAISVALLLVLVVPQFSQLFADMGQALPTATRVVIALGDGVRDWWWLMLLSVTLAVLYFRSLLAKPGFRLRWDEAMLRLPVWGDLVRKVEMARLGHTLSTLLHNGVPVLRSIQIAGAVVSNRTLRASLDEAADQLKKGRGLAEPLLESGRFPRLAVQMIKVGEESGQLDEMLARVADVYDREVKAAIARALALLEPILIVGLGIVIAGIILSILVAVLSVNELAF